MFSSVDFWLKAWVTDGLKRQQTVRRLFRSLHFDELAVKAQNHDRGNPVSHELRALVPTGQFQNRR